jgi:hypothetical protein
VVKKQLLAAAKHLIAAGEVLQPLHFLTFLKQN